MNMASPRPAGEPETYAYEQGYYAAGDAYGQSRLAFGVPPENAALGNTLIAKLTGIDVRAAAARPGTDSSTNGPKPRPACSRGLPSSRTWRITPPSNIAGSC